MNDVLRELHRKMDEIIGRQERSLSVLTAIQVRRSDFLWEKYNIKLCDCQNTGGGRAPAAPAVAGGQPVDTIRRDEVAPKSYFHPYCNLPKGEIAIGRDKMGAPIWGHPNFRPKHQVNLK